MLQDMLLTIPIVMMQHQQYIQGKLEICYDGLDTLQTTIDEGCTPIVSVVQSAQCGVT
jgi:hypothetical protein